MPTMLEYEWVRRGLLPPKYLTQAQEAEAHERSVLRQVSQKMAEKIDRDMIAIQDDGETAN